MKEVFVIYDKTTGLISGGSGRINRAWDAVNKDGSTMSERIPLILAKNNNREVIYLPDQFLPDASKHKIEAGKIVELTEEDKLPAKTEQENEKKINKEMRRIAIETLKISGELSAGFIDSKH